MPKNAKYPTRACQSARRETRQTAIAASAPGNIEAGGVEDWFRFTAATAGVYSISSELGTLPDTVMYLYGPESQQTLVTWNDDVGAKRASYIETSLVPGEYYIKVKAYRITQTGSYTLHLGAP